MNLPSWAVTTTSDEQRKLYGAPLSEFYTRDKTVKIPGRGKLRNIDFYTSRFRYEQNVYHFPPVALVKSVNHAITTILEESKIDIEKKVAHLRLTHSGLRYDNQIHIALNSRNDPGQTAWNTIERFIQSNKSIEFVEMMFDVVTRA